MIEQYCKKVKIGWFASAFDIESQKFLKRYKTKHNKITSAMITNLKFLDFVAKEKKVTFISTGMCEMKHIKNAVNIFKKNKCPFILMHSVSMYPCPMKDLNLKMIQTLKDKFKCDMGYSGHEVNVGPSVYAACLGANYIERHITIDRSMWGTDQAASLGPDGMKLLRNLLDKYELSIGTGVKKFLPEEKDKLKTMKYW